jgi:hypothetical protein
LRRDLKVLTGNFYSPGAALKRGLRKFFGFLWSDHHLTVEQFVFSQNKNTSTPLEASYLEPAHKL